MHVFSSVVSAGGISGIGEPHEPTPATSVSLVYIQLLVPLLVSTSFTPGLHVVPPAMSTPKNVAGTLTMRAVTPGDMRSRSLAMEPLPWQTLLVPHFATKIPVMHGGGALG